MNRQTKSSKRALRRHPAAHENMSWRTCGDQSGEYLREELVADPEIDNCISTANARLQTERRQAATELHSAPR